MPWRRWRSSTPLQAGGVCVLLGLAVEQLHLGPACWHMLSQGGATLCCLHGHAQ